MNPINARLPRHIGDDAALATPLDAAPAASTGWLAPLLWLCAIGAVVGTTLRRPLRGPWDAGDVGWALLFAALAGLLIIPYRLWQIHAARQSRDCLALIRGDTLFVFPDPDREQRVPLLGVTRVVQGASRGDSTEIVTERAAAMLDANFQLSLDAAQTARLVTFVNECLRQEVGAIEPES